MLDSKIQVVENEEMEWYFMPIIAKESKSCF